MTKSRFFKENTVAAEKALREKAEKAAAEATLVKAAQLRQAAAQRKAFASSRLGAVSHNVGPTTGQLAIRNELHGLSNESKLRRSLKELEEFANSEKAAAENVAAARAAVSKRRAELNAESAARASSPERIAREKYLQESEAEKNKVVFAPQSRKQELKDILYPRNEKVEFVLAGNNPGVPVTKPLGVDPIPLTYFPDPEGPAVIPKYTPPHP